ncbi:MAG: hypothetical protein ABEH38_02780 [Flavobacteriales bacterium]
MTDTLHIVSFDIPHPPVYGGVIDVMYKIRALADQGARIHLHCFHDQREAAPALEEYCEKVDYYPRLTRHREHLSRSPYIVNSRRAEGLKQRILKEPGPILFEGLHTCHLLSDPELQELPKWVRTHNIEHEYYRGLMASERSPLKRRYYQIEAAKLERFEKILRYADLILAINPREKEHFQRYSTSIHLPPFHPYKKVGPERTDRGFALYHGKLSVSENEKAALYLLEEVLPNLEIPFIIAGEGASERLLEKVGECPNASYEACNSPERIDELIQEARVNVLPTFQATGIKLKLLAALFKGRHCVVNPPMVQGTGLEGLCRIGQDAEGLRSELEQCMQEPFEKEQIRERNGILLTDLNNQRNGDLLLKRQELTRSPSNLHT